MSGLPLWEVFIRPRRGLNHVHVGSLHAPDAEMALRNARDVYTRRSEGVSIWVVAAGDITASSPAEKEAFFAPAADTTYRHHTFYEVPDGIEHPGQRTRRSANPPTPTRRSRPRSPTR